MIRDALRPTILLGAIFALGTSACDCGGDLRDVSSTEVEIVSPAHGDLVSHEAPVTFTARARNGSGLKSLSLLVGEIELDRCATGSAEGGRTADDHEIECTADFMTPDFASEVTSGRFRLTAVAIDGRDREVRTHVDVVVRPVRIIFVDPVSEAGEPPLLTGTSRLKIEVTGTLPVDVLDVTYTPLTEDEGERQEFRLRRFSEPPFEDNINWAPLMGTGNFRLTAYARDIQGNSDTAVLEIVVHCTGDGECGDGTRCCIDNGLCYETVGAGELCDCTRPCPVWQGCFPGTCGQYPRRCRPGCYPGDLNCTPDTCTEANQAQKCSLQEGLPAYCTALPAAERTEENRGGACAPADTCNVMSQNCPNMPLDRTLPPSETNPVVPHKCVPVSPTTNACVPEGPTAIGQRCSGGRCGESAAEQGCVKGANCVVLYSNGTPVDVKCMKLCTRNSDCGFLGTCSKLYGAGWEEYTVGVCQ